MDEIRIAKKLCERVDTRFQDGYYIKMPTTSKYAGYRFYVSAWFCDLTATYAAITKSKNEGYNHTFTLEKIDREPGKRYQRPKLSFEELKAELADHSKQFYSEALPQALAYLKAYANNGSRSAGAVIAHYFCVGGYDKTWFYESDAERRRLNTNGVRILKVLSPEEAEQMKAKLKRYRELNRATDNFENCYIDYRQEYFYKVMQRTLKPDIYKTITEKLEEINSLVASEAAASVREREELNKYFNAFLEN